ncbi:MAG: transporter substrate-binding domain-containing protein [Thermodesulfobacteriota bacterium]
MGKLAGNALGACVAVVLSVLAWVFFYAPTAAWAQEVIRVRVTHFPPQYFQDQAGEWTGLDVELARALVVEAGYTPRFISRPWSRALKEMESGELHLMMNLSQTTERSVYLDWIGPERTGELALIVRKGDENLPVHGIDDLPRVAAARGKKFGVQADIYYSDEFMEKLKDPAFAAHFETVSKADNNLMMTVSGRILGFFEDRDSLSYRIAHDPQYRDLAVHPFVISSEDVYFGVSKKVPPGVLPRLREAFKRLEKNGTLEEIRKRTW